MMRGDKNNKELKASLKSGIKGECMVVLALIKSSTFVAWNAGYKLPRSYWASWAAGA